MFPKRITRFFSTKIPKFDNEKDLRLALIKSGCIHARKVGFNDECLTEACKDFGYPSVNYFFITNTSCRLQHQW